MKAGTVNPVSQMSPFLASKRLPRCLQKPGPLQRIFSRWQSLLRSELTNPPNRQFEHFGVLDSGSQNKGAFFGSILFNLILLFIAIIIGASVKKTIDQRKKMELTFVVPVKEPPPQPKVKVPPPPKLPPPPKPIETPEPPKIKLPEVKLVEPPKPIPVAAPKPVPVVVPAPPKIQQAAAAPKVVSVTMAAKSASVVNNDPHPTAVALGHPDSPVPFQKSGPAVASVNMNRGMAGMPLDELRRRAAGEGNQPGQWKPERTDWRHCCREG